jgi:hypothetical protein
MALVALSLDADDEIREIDIAHPDGPIIGVGIDDASLYLGRDRTDGSAVAACNRLIGVLVGLRDAAARRMALADLPSDTPLGIEDDVAGEGVAS